MLDQDPVDVPQLPGSALPAVVPVQQRVQEGVAAVALLGRLVDGVGDEAEAGRAHQDDLEHPVADVRDGEGLVVAGLVAAGLHGVADEHGLLVLVNGLTNDGHDQDTEYHHHGQQDSEDKEREGKRQGMEKVCEIL